MNGKSNGPTATLPEVAALFLRLGATAFGGPAAHVALMEEEFVRRRKWISHEEFLDLLAATQLIPGPNSTEMAIHIGRRCGGWSGLWIAGICFIAPAALLVSACAWFYTRYGSLPQVESVLYGVKPVIIAVVLQALWNLSKTALKTKLLVLAALAAAAAHQLGVSELTVLFSTGAAVALLSYWNRTGSGERLKSSLAAAPLLPIALASGTGTASAPFGLGALFLFFLKVGSVLFGSGYVLLAFLQADLVDRWHWLTEEQLLDAIAVGQVTPGPVFTAATFIGFLLGGPAGGIVATVGIFLPAFFFVAVSGPLIPRLRRSPWTGPFLDGLIAASLALMAVVTWTLAEAAIVDGVTVALALASAVLLIGLRVNSVWLVLGGAGIGLASTAF